MEQDGRLDGDGIVEAVPHALEVAQEGEGVVPPVIAARRVGVEGSGLRHNRCIHHPALGC